MAPTNNKFSKLLLKNTFSKFLPQKSPYPDF